MSKENCNNAQEVAQKADFGNEEVPFLGLLKNTPSKSLIFGQQLTSRKKIWQGMSVRQKLGTILENKVVQKLKLENNVFSKKWSPKYVLSNEKWYFVTIIVLTYCEKKLF